MARGFRRRLLMHGQSCRHIRSRTLTDQPIIAQNNENADPDEATKGDGGRKNGRRERLLLGMRKLGDAKLNEATVIDDPMPTDCHGNSSDDSETLAQGRTDGRREQLIQAKSNPGDASLDLSAVIDDPMPTDFHSDGGDDDGARLLRAAVAVVSAGHRCQRESLAGAGHSETLAQGCKEGRGKRLLKAERIPGDARLNLTANINDPPPTGGRGGGGGDGARRLRAAVAVVSAGRRYQRETLVGAGHKEGALLRALRRTAEVRDLRFTEMAALYESSTVRYVHALDGGDSSAHAATTLAQIFDDLEAREVRLFCAALLQAEASSAAAREEEDEGACLTPLGGVLRASTELLAETEILWDDARRRAVRSFLPPGFAPHCAVDLAWMAAVSFVCAQQIHAQIGGGGRGSGLHGLSATDLLDVIAWVEQFRSAVERTDPGLISRLRNTGATAADLDDKSSRPRLLSGSNKSKGGVTEEDAADGLAWVLDALWTVHQQAQDELLILSRERTLEWVKAAYGIGDQSLRTEQDGRLFTSLCEDVFSLMAVRLRTVCDRLPRSSQTLAATIVGNISALGTVHREEGGKRLANFEIRCAAANDYERMGEECEAITSEMLSEFFHCSDDDVGGNDDDEDKKIARPSMKSVLQSISSDLVHTYIGDSVHAAKSIVVPVFDPIRVAIGSELFGPEWEDGWTHNELARTLTATVEDFLQDMKSYLGEYLLAKAVGALCSASVVFYVECLLKRAGGRGGVEASSFGNNARALRRMNGDIDILRGFFEELVPEMPTLARTIEEEFKVLATIHELMSVGAGLSASEASLGAGLSSSEEAWNFILILHKSIHVEDITKRVVRDIWRLVSSREESEIMKLIESREADLQALTLPSPNDGAAIARATAKEQDEWHIPGLRLDEMMAELYATEMSGRLFKNIVARGRKKVSPILHSVMDSNLHQRLALPTRVSRGNAIRMVETTKPTGLH